MTLHHLLQPTSIAIIGASKDPNKLGNIVVRNLQQGGFTGAIFPVNLDGGMINGLQAYTHCNTLPTIPDLCIISLPLGVVLNALQEAISWGCKTYIVFTAGFKEIGEEGERVEQELIALAKQAKITLLGPNCLGGAHTPSMMNATFADIALLPGNLRIISQSGAIASAFFDRAKSTQMGFESCLTIGNKAVIDECDLLSYRIENQNNNYNPIALYLEEISNGKEFIGLVKKVTTHTPVILLKPGKSLAAQQAMQSHTGSIAGDEQILQAACIEANCIRAENLQQFFNLAMYCSWQPAPRGKRIALITNAGGPGVITTDLLDAAGLTTAQLSKQTEEELIKLLPRAASVHDPIDVLGDAPASRYAQALQVIIDDVADIDAIMIILTPQVMTQIKQTAEIIVEISKAHQIPIVCTFIGDYDVTEGKKILREHQIPCYSYPNEAVYVLSKTAGWFERTKNIYPDQTNSITTGESIAYPSGLLNAEQTTNLLNKYNIQTPKQILTVSLEEAKQFFEKIGQPVVMKAVGPNLLHKIDKGGVITGIGTQQQLIEAWEKLTNLFHGDSSIQILVQEQIEQGLEYIIGIKQDKSFGTALVFGTGGTFTELLHDHTIQLLPRSIEQVRELVEKSGSIRLLEGYRGAKPKNKQSLIETIRGFVSLVHEYPSLVIAEINPLIVTEKGTRAVDPKLVF